MLLVSEVGGEGGCIKLDKISLGLKKFRRVDPDLRGNNADGTCKLALRVEDRGTDPDSIVDIFSARTATPLPAENMSTIPTASLTYSPRVMA